MDYLRRRVVVHVHNPAARFLSNAADHFSAQSKLRAIMQIREIESCKRTSERDIKRHCSSVIQVEARENPSLQSCDDGRRGNTKEKLIWIYILGRFLTSSSWLGKPLVAFGVFLLLQINKQLWRSSFVIEKGRTRNKSVDAQKAAAATTCRTTGWRRRRRRKFTGKARVAREREKNLSRLYTWDTRLGSV